MPRTNGDRRRAEDDDVERIVRAFGEQRRSLVRFAATVCGPSSAEDVVAGVFARLIARPPSGVSDLRAYCLRGVYHAAIDENRRKQRAQRRQDLLLARVVVDQRRASQAEAVDEAVVTALLSLPGQQRAVVYLTYWEDRTPAQIAEVLGVSEGSVRKQLARARKRLRGALEGTR